MSVKKFRLQAKKLFLTYPRTPTNLNCRDVLAYFAALLPLEQYCIVKELHQDGNEHIHAVLVLERKADITNPHFLDFPFEQENGEIIRLHGNYQTVRDIKASVKYMHKAYIDICTNLTLGSKGEIIKDIFWAEVLRLADAGQKDQAFQLVRLHDPKTALFKEEKLKAIFYKKAMAVTLAPVIFPFEQFRLNPFLEALVFAIEELKLYEKYTLVFWGPSETGKTAFVQALCIKWGIPFKRMSYKEALQYVETNGEPCIVWIDDMELDPIFKSRTRAINLTDVPAGGSLDRRYNPLDLPPGVGRIISTNQFPQEFTHFKEGGHKKKVPRHEVERRLFFIYIDEPLYSESNRWDPEIKEEYEQSPFFQDKQYFERIKKKDGKKLKQAIQLYVKRAAEEPNFPDKLKTLNFLLKGYDFPPIKALPAPIKKPSKKPTRVKKSDLPAIFRKRKVTNLKEKLKC